MLATALRSHGACAWLTGGDEPFQPPPDIVVLFGQGPEFATLEVPCTVPAGTRPKVVLWALDPLPPPGLPSSVVRWQLLLAATRLRLRGGAPAGRRTPLSWLRGHVKRGIRDVAAGSSPFADPARRARSGVTAAMWFLRLQWITRRVAAGWIDHVMGTNSAMVETLRERGIEAALMPVGYHPAMGRDEGLPRDFDAVFLGSLDSWVPARAERLRAISTGLATRGIEVNAQSGLWGAERAAFLNRAKIIVNVRTNTWHPELIRFVLASACGVMIVSETPETYTEPFRAGTHFVAAPTSEIPDVVAHYLAHDSERQAMVDAAKELIAIHVTMDAAAVHVLGMRGAS